MHDICGIDEKSVKDGKVWVRIRGTNPTIQKPVAEISYEETMAAVVFRYKDEHCKRMVNITNLDIMIIAYTDGTERIVQLNRSLENNILKSIEYLTNMVYSQLGVTQEILNGTADEKTMNNYMNRIIEPVVSAIADEFNRKFLTKTARTQGQSIMCFHDPFRLAPVSMIAEMADKFTRNEIMTPNEIRQIIGMKPSKDPKSDQLVNRNIASADKGMPVQGKENDADEQANANQQEGV